MTQTDRILGNIGAIRTLIEKFPMGLFETDSKNYKSAFEFIMDILMACGVEPEELVSYLIGEIYGFEGQVGYSINGLYERIRRGEIKVDMQNPFINGLEVSIKSILMALFTSIYTCSALPIFPNKVFDYDSLPNLMDYNVEAITRRNPNNDNNYKLRIPIAAIDMMNMFSISPTTSEGSVYYLTDGHDTYYKKEYITRNYTVTQSQVVNAGERFKTKISQYTNEYEIRFSYPFFGDINFDVYKRDIIHGTQPVLSPIPIPVTIEVTYLNGLMDAPNTKTVILDSTGCDLRVESSVVRPGTEDILPNEILGISINGNPVGCEIGDNVENMSWCFLKCTESEAFNWENCYDHGVNLGGVPLNPSMFGTSRSGQTIVIDKVAEFTDTYNCEVEMSSTTLVYKSVENPDKSIMKNAIRYPYVPDIVYDNDPDSIVCFHGDNPNLIYRAYDMNAFLWYCYNRCNVANQIEQNHLMWDSRISAAKNGVKRDGGTEWNDWYASKNEEGAEFGYNANTESDIIYPIIQVEKYSESELLVRIPAQRYFLPKKRKEISDGSFVPGKHYFNASIYRFDWEYLKNIQILNPKLLLVRLVEGLIGLAMDTASSLQYDINKKRIEAVLEKAIKSIITANDMEVEDCWKSFSNEDYNDLLNEMLLSRYTAIKTNGESSSVKTFDIQEYVNQLGQISSNATSQGTKTMITKSVTEVMMSGGSEAETEYSFDYGFDSDMLSKLIWAIVMPIIESLLTPQVMLLMLINFQLMGVVNLDDAFGIDFGKILNLLLNKILGLIKSIVLYVKDKIISLLLDLFKKVITPILTNMMLMLYLEMITDWLIILLEAVKCIPLMLGITVVKEGYIDEVDYADIVNNQSIPESSSEC